MDDSRTKFLKKNIRKITILICAFFVVAYTLFLLTLEPGNKILFGLLVFEQIFFAWQGLNYLFTIWNTEHQNKFDPEYTPSVDVFVTVAGEPTDIVRETLEAILKMDYPNFKVFILNDGYVAKKENW
jgi:cellulose synthase (UDP-forming)